MVELSFTITTTIIIIIMVIVEEEENRGSLGFKHNYESLSTYSTGLGHF